jgi:hypothetical protein
MKASEITQIIEANPQAIFCHKSNNSKFIIEGFTTTQRSRHATPTKVAITRSVWISINDNNEGTIKIAEQVHTCALTSIAGECYSSPDAMCRGQIKARITEIATQETRAKRHANFAELSTNMSLAFAHHEIETTWGTIRADSDHLTIKLTLEQAQALLNIIEG